MFLDKVQSHHLVNVLRLKTGDKIVLFDKEGNTYQAEIISLGKQVRLNILAQKRMTNHHSRITITLATAIPKGKRMDWLVEKCAELGLDRLIPLETRFSVVKDPGESKIARWRKIALAAAKQSQNLPVMEITETLPWAKLLDRIGDYDLRLLVTPEGEACGFKGLGQVNRLLYVIGPEGGFSPQEIAQAKSIGFKPVRLPVSGILRVETAAVAMLAIWRYQSYGNG